MFDQIFGKIPAFDSTFASVKEFNRLTLDTVEKFTQFQLDKTRAYTEAGLGQVRAALEVKDARALHDYLQSRPQVAQELSRQLQEDFKALTDIGTRYGVETQQLLRDQLTAAADTAKKAA